MTQRVSSAILTRANSMKRQTLPGLRKSIQGTFTNDGGYEMNEYIHKKFFDGENYQSILKCLDDGYDVYTDLIEYMQDYCTLLKGFIQSLTSYSNKWKSKINHRPALSSYHTTKRAQIRTVTAPVKLSQLIQTRIDAIEQVIAAFRKKIDRLYPGERFGTVHKHYRTDVLKKQFKNASTPVSKISSKLDDLREQEKRAEKSLLNARIECQNLGLNETTSKSKLSKANERLEKKQDDFNEIEERITRAEDDHHREQKVYHQKAMEIYQEYRGLEAERLNIIRETLIKFIQAIHTTEYVNQQEEMYGKLLAQIDSEQDTDSDLNFWAETYHVGTFSRSVSVETTENEQNENEITTSQSTTQKPSKSQKNETKSLTTIKETTTQPSMEPEEKQSATDKPTTTSKTKQKKKRNTTPDPTTPDVS